MRKNVRKTTLRGSAVYRLAICGCASIAALCWLCVAAPLHAQNGSAGNEKPGGLGNVNHIVVIMQENHSFDNYFGALAHAPNTPYHGPGLFDRDWDRDDNSLSGCREGDHDCVDGLSCTEDAAGNLHCFNANLDDDGHFAFAFHDTRRCVVPDLDHEWFTSHEEANFQHPNDSLGRPLNNGFVLVNDQTEQHDNGVESATDDQTMSFYDQDELPFYYNLAENFAISDRYFASVIGPTFPNRSYLAAATSFGHLTTSDTFPPPGGYQPITGTIFDLITNNKVSWADYLIESGAVGRIRPSRVTREGRAQLFGVGHGVVGRLDQIRGALRAATWLKAGGRIREIRALARSYAIRGECPALVRSRWMNVIVEASVLIVGEQHD